MKRLKVTNDGTPLGTKLFDADTGEELCLDKAATIIWINRINEAPRVIVEFMLPEIKVEGDVFLGAESDRESGLAVYRRLLTPKGEWTGRTDPLDDPTEKITDELPETESTDEAIESPASKEDQE